MSSATLRQNQTSCKKQSCRKRRRRRKLGVVLDSWVSDLVDFSWNEDASFSKPFSLFFQADED